MNTENRQRWTITWANAVPEEANHSQGTGRALKSVIQECSSETYETVSKQTLNQNNQKQGSLVQVLGLYKKKSFGHLGK